MEKTYCVEHHTWAKRRECMSLLYRQRYRGSARAILCFAMSCIFLVTCLVRSVPATAIAEDSSNGVDTEGQVKDKPSQKYESAQPKESKGQDSKTKWIIIGGTAAIGIGAIAIGAGGGSSGGGGGGSNQPACEEELIGPSLAGEWQGVLDLKNYGSQPVTATINQCGERITITTSTTLPYGQSFSGRVSSGGSILLKEGVTYQIWSSHLGPARTNDLRVYDYVNNQTQLDSLKLSR